MGGPPNSLYFADAAILSTNKKMLAVLFRAHPVPDWHWYHPAPSIGSLHMQQIDFSNLLGFSSVSPLLSEGVDFQDETIAARLGAKVGIEKKPREHRDGIDDSGTDTNKAAILDKIDYSKLLGFEGVSDQLSGSVNFQDDTINAKLGAKVGVEAMF
jgi:hypothetical protein